MKNLSGLFFGIGPSKVVRIAAPIAAALDAGGQT